MKPTLCGVIIQDTCIYPSNNRTWKTVKYQNKDAKKWKTNTEMIRLFITKINEKKKKKDIRVQKRKKK